MDEGQAGGALKVGEMMIACLLIIIACMAQYCNYWRKRKSLIDGDIIADDIIYGVEVVFHPYTLLNNQLFIESGWIYVMNDVEAQEFGL